MRQRRQRPLLLSPGGPLVFPDARLADDEGLVAIGGDLRLERLLLAYRSGIFPWYDAGVPPLWWSPDPRAIFELDRLHVSRSLRRRIRQGRFRLSHNQEFERVMRECAAGREGGTWILPEMIEAYSELYRCGFGHSIEVWMDGELAGGLYGVQYGALFAAESMFHRRVDASKIALILTVRGLFSAGIELFDVQFLTPHLASLGAREIPRRGYLDRLGRARDRKVNLSAVDVGGWRQSFL